MKSYIKPIQKVVRLDETELICESAPADSQSLDDVFDTTPTSSNFDSDVKGKRLWDELW